MLGTDFALDVAGGYSFEGLEKPNKTKATLKPPGFTRRGWLPLHLSGLSCEIGCSV